MHIYIYVVLLTFRDVPSHPPSFMNPFNQKTAMQSHDAHRAVTLGLGSLSNSYAACLDI